MKYLEIIELRTIGSKVIELDRQINDLIENLIQTEEVKSIRIYNRLGVANAVSIHLPHDQFSIKNQGSQIGLSLVSALKNYGLVSHTIWIEKYHIQNS
jgi:hypothetical protein